MMMELKLCMNCIEHGVNMKLTIKGFIARYQQRIEDNIMELTKEDAIAYLERNKFEKRGFGYYKYVPSGRDAEKTEYFATLEEV